MEYFIDTAVICEIKDANAVGFVDGVKTNPSSLVNIPERWDKAPE